MKLWMGMRVKNLSQIRTKTHHSIIGDFATILATQLCCAVKERYSKHSRFAFEFKSIYYEFVLLLGWQVCKSIRWRCQTNAIDSFSSFIHSFSSFIHSFLLNESTVNTIRRTNKVEVNWISSLTIFYYCIINYQQSIIRL